MASPKAVMVNRRKASIRGRKGGNNSHSDPAEASTGVWSEASPLSHAGLPKNPFEGPLGTPGSQALPRAGDSMRIRGIIGGGWVLGTQVVLGQVLWDARLGVWEPLYRNSEDLLAECSRPLTWLRLSFVV